MSQGAVTVEGADRLAATLSVAAADLGNLDHAAAATSRVVATAGRYNAPRRTGVLAASVRAMPEGGTGAVGTSVRYAPFVHYGTRYMRARPFLTNATRQTEPVWVGLYTADADRALARVRGV